MELRKKKETIWEIKRKDENGSFKLRSVEEGDEITLISIGLSKNQNDIFFEMTPSEFQNFYSIIKSFKGLLNSKGVEFHDDIVVEDKHEDKKSHEEEISFEDEEEIKQKEHEKLTQEIKSTTIQELENLKQFEKAQKKLSEFSKPINYQEENNYNVSSEKVKSKEFDATDIFAELDRIEPSIEKGTNLYDEYSSDQVSNSEVLTKSKEILNKSKDDEEEEQLDPRDWDPW